MTATPAPFVSVLVDPTRIIYGAEYLEDPAHPVNRSLPGVTPAHKGAYLPTDIRRNLRWTAPGVAVPINQTEEEGWHHVPSPRVMKRRARAAELRKERQGWMCSLTELTETLPPL